jgi:hypothetical protein
VQSRVTEANGDLERDDDSPQARAGERGQEGRTHDLAGRRGQLHPSGRQSWRPRRDQLRIGFRRAHGPVPDAREGGGDAHRRRRPQVRPPRGRARGGAGQHPPRPGAQVEHSGKPANVIDKIIEGKLGSFYSQAVLLEQPSIRDAAVTIQQLVAEASAKLGENIAISRFARFRVGDAT